MWPMASLLASAVPTGYGGTGGSEIPPWVLRMYIWNQSVPVPSPAPALPGGLLEGPPEVAWVLLPLAEADPPLWRGVDAFPLCLGAAVVPLWPEVDGHAPWLRECSHQLLVSTIQLWCNQDPLNLNCLRCQSMRMHSCMVSYCHQCCQNNRGGGLSTPTGGWLSPVQPPP